MTDEESVALWTKVVALFQMPFWAVAGVPMLWEIYRRWTLWGYLRRIRKHGWTGTYVPGDAETGALVYSTGFWECIKAPEIVMFGFDETWGNGLLHHAHDEIKSGVVATGAGLLEGGRFAAVDAFAGQPWTALPWYLGESFLYARVRAAVRFAETRADPFLAVKEREEASLDCASDDEETVETALWRSLWGNRADLSLPSAGRFTASDGDVGSVSNITLAPFETFGFRVTTTDNISEFGKLSITNFTATPTAASEVPAPLPLAGAAAAFSWSRRLRRRSHALRS
jgi:hypothetical protein